MVPLALQTLIGSTNLVQLVIVLVVVGLVWYLIETYIPIAAPWAVSESRGRQCNTERHRKSAALRAVSLHMSDGASFVLDSLLDVAFHLRST